MKSYIGGKYIPLKLVLFPSLAMFAALFFLLMPITLSIKSVPFENWPSAFWMLTLIGLTMVGFFSTMAWVFCELCASNFSRIKAAITFGVISPFVFILMLTLVAMTKGHDFLSGINMPQGIENIAILGASAFVFAVIIFWQSTKNT
ncbi:hypothetical protein [Cognaticolwellia mytili]|uniref:hypothetical protein n=1 Tax=Cognaticolwellia mytili TaxID=1888913 RepID=UPI000A173725|nr:hypothetical protein [Cognaticolwellia mytili]